MTTSTPTPKPRGALIVLEGLDRAGKSTQCARLAASLRARGHSVESIRFPDRSTPIGQMINSYLSGTAHTEDHVIHLLFSANRWEAAARIRQLIAQGKTVVVDRYYYSGCVYSAAKDVAGMGLEWCRAMEVGLPRPDVCLFLDLAAEEAERRGGYGAERYERKEMQDRVRELFKEMRRHEDEGEDVVVVDAGGSVEEVEGEIWRVVEERLGEEGRGRGELRSVRPW